MQFTGKTCVVTGGANGIGRRIVERFAAAGASVAFIDKDGPSGNALAEKLGGRVYFMEGDIADEHVLPVFAEAVAGRFGLVHSLVNNACEGRKGILSGCGYDDFLAVLRLGVAAPYMLASLFFNRFAPGAAIVNIASTRAFMSQADTESYAAAKGGIVALTHALSLSLAGKVRVNAVSPGWIDTAAFQGSPRNGEAPGEPDRRQHPVGRIGVPDDIAAMVLFLCGDEAGFITGQNVIVDGGMTRQMIYHGDDGWTYAPPRNT
ncbi:MAG: SDR family oxidoreductase [Deltaproteobacteria bacterium]|nr:SDR family oxidoreductase [Deltaproteobacteria bacterium]